MSTTTQENKTDNARKELLPCPFCRNAGFISVMTHETHPLYKAQCCECECKIGCYYSVRQDAIDVWNTRVITPSHEAALASIDGENLLTLKASQLFLQEAITPYEKVCTRKLVLATKRIIELDEALDSALQTNQAMGRKLKETEANKNELARRNGLLRERDDLPVDRIPAHQELLRLQARIAELEAKPAKQECVHQLYELTDKPNSPEIPDSSKATVPIVSGDEALEIGAEAIFEEYYPNGYGEIRTFRELKNIAPSHYKNLLRNARAVLVSAGIIPKTGG